MFILLLKLLYGVGMLGKAESASCEGTVNLITDLGVGKGGNMEGNLMSMEHLYVLPDCPQREIFWGAFHSQCFGCSW